ncbi:MAG: 4-(cytidine 5'-diphospho)-2-C-methyl-D-erythritol kinase [Paracoccaceae bacterium]
MTTTEFAPAKINLTLHVTGQRADGYHLLDSLVVFADTGDRVTVAAADALRFTITGPQAAALAAGDDNLVLRAARALWGDGTAAITLEKMLPVASGIGGGSSDAAATLRALAALWRLPLPAPAVVLALGADVPVCLQGHAVRMTGVGDGLQPLAAPLPPAWLVLANPGVSIPTPDVFRALIRRDGSGMPRDLPKLKTLPDLSAFLQMMRNDLEAPAMQLAPVISLTKAALSALPGCLMARMSGSGATCFGLFSDPLTATAAARSLAAAHPDWWVTSARILS